MHHLMQTQAYRHTDTLSEGERDVVVVRVSGHSGLKNFADDKISDSEIMFRLRKDHYQAIILRKIF